MIRKEVRHQKLYSGVDIFYFSLSTYILNWY